MPDSRGLERALLDAHAAGDGRVLAGLYADAARLAAAEGRAEAEGFFLTHAYVFALASGDPAAERLHARLVALGRDE